MYQANKKTHKGPWSHKSFLQLLKSVSFVGLLCWSFDSVPFVSSLCLWETPSSVHAGKQTAMQLPACTLLLFPQPYRWMVRRAAFPGSSSPSCLGWPALPIHFEGCFLPTRAWRTAQALQLLEPIFSILTESQDFFASRSPQESLAGAVQRLPWKFNMGTLSRVSTSRSPQHMSCDHRMSTVPPLCSGGCAFLHLENINVFYKNLGKTELRK